MLAIYLCSGIIWFFQWYDILHRDYPVIQGYVFVVINISIFVMLHRAIRKKIARGLSRKINTIAERGKHFHVQRSFVRLNFMLLFVLILCFASEEEFTWDLMMLILIHLKIGINPFV